MSDPMQEHAAAILDVKNLTIRVDLGTLVRTPDGRVWCRQEPDIGGWEIVPPAVVGMLAEARASVDTLYQCVLDISDEAFLCGVSADTSDRIREIEQRAKAIIGDGNLTTIPQISVVYTCCKAQEYWPLTANGELEMEHSALGATCGAHTGTYQDRMDALRRERDEAKAKAAMVTMHDNVMTGSMDVRVVPPGPSLRTQLAEANARAARWRRLAEAYEAYDLATTDEEANAAQREADAVGADLEAHGDLDAEAPGDTEERM